MTEHDAKQRFNAAKTAVEQRAARVGDPGEHTTTHQEDLLDEALIETFPASDPISPHRI